MRGVYFHQTPRSARASCPPGLVMQPTGYMTTRAIELLTVGLIMPDLLLSLPWFPESSGVVLALALGLALRRLRLASNTLIFAERRSERGTI